MPARKIIIHLLVLCSFGFANEIIDYKNLEKTISFVLKSTNVLYSLSGPTADINPKKIIKSPMPWSKNSFRHDKNFAQVLIEKMDEYSDYNLNYLLKHNEIKDTFSSLDIDFILQQIETQDFKKWHQSIEHQNRYTIPTSRPNVSFYHFTLPVYNVNKDIFLIQIERKEYKLSVNPEGKSYEVGEMATFMFKKINGSWKLVYRTPILVW